MPAPASVLTYILPFITGCLLFTPVATAQRSPATAATRPADQNAPPIQPSDFFAWLPEPFPSTNRPLLHVDHRFASSGSTWLKGLDEKNVFHATLHAQGGSWRAGIGQGAQIYSLRGSFGESIPPQIHKSSEWNDEVWQLVAVNLDRQNLAQQTKKKYFIHGSGIYRRDPAAPINFYGPIISTWHDQARNSYAIMTWPQHAHVPTPFTSEVFFLTRFTPLSPDVLEVVYGVHNWGSVSLDFFNVPWGGVRGKTFAHRSYADPHHHLLAQDGAFPNPKEGLPLEKTGGYLLFATSDQPDAQAMALVLGSTIEQWPDARLLWRGGYAGPEPNERDYAVTSVILRGTLDPHQSFWRRVYFVFGDSTTVRAKAAQLAPHARVRRICWSSAPNDAPHRDATARLEPSPVPLPGYVPLFELNPGDGRPTRQTIDPYLYAPTEPYTNPLPKDHRAHAWFNNLTIQRPYLLTKATWRLLGFIPVQHPRETQATSP